MNDHNCNNPYPNYLALGAPTPLPLKFALGLFLVLLGLSLLSNVVLGQGGPLPYWDCEYRQIEIWLPASNTEGAKEYYVTQLILVSDQAYLTPDDLWEQCFLLPISDVGAS